MRPEVQPERNRVDPDREKTSETTANPYQYDPRTYHAWLKRFQEKLATLPEKHQAELTPAELRTATFGGYKKRMPTGSAFYSPERILDKVGLRKDHDVRPVAFMSTKFFAANFKDPFAAALNLEKESLTSANLHETLQFIANDLPLWRVLKTKQDEHLTLLSPEAVSAPLFLITRRLFNRMLLDHQAHYFNYSGNSQFSARVRQHLVLLGRLFGEFTEETPRSILLRILLTPHISDDDPEYVQQLRWDKETDTVALKKLKGFWREVFSTYWLASARVHGYDTATPLAVDVRESAHQRLPHYPRNVVPRTTPTLRKGGIDVVAEGMETLASSTQTQKLRVYLAETLQKYAPAEKRASITPVLLKNIIHPRVASQILALTYAFLLEHKSADLNNEHLAPLAEQLNALLENEESGQTSSQNLLEEVLGRKLTSLSPIEVVSLLSFTAFLQNGGRTREEVAAVEQLQLKLIPALENYHTQDYDLKEDELKQNPTKEAWEAAAEYATFALNHELPSFSIVSAKDPEALRLVQEYEEQIEKAWNMGWRRLRILRNLPPYALSGAANYQAAFLAFKLVALIYAANSIKAQEHMAASVFSLVFGALFYLATRKLMVVERLADTRFNQSSAAFTNQTKQQVSEQMGSVNKWSAALFFTSALVFTLVNEVERRDIHLDDLFSGGGPSIDLGGNTNSKLSVPTQWNLPDNYEVGNREERGRSGVGKPRFYVYNAPTRLFWADTVCQAVADADFAHRFICEESVSSIQPLTAIEQYAELDSFREAVQESVATGKLVRMNYGDDKEYGIPAGYFPSRVFTLLPSEEEVWILNPHVNWHSATGIDVGRVSLSAIEYERIPGGDYTTLAPSDAFIETISNDIVPDEVAQTPEYQVIEQIVTAARLAKEHGSSTREVLELIKQKIGDLGVSYGYADYPPAQESVHEKLLRLFEQKADGTLVNTKWICNQFAFATHMIAKEAGIQTHLLLGMVSEVSRPDNGYNSQLHALVRFQNEESGEYEIFESTLPSVEFLEGENPSPSASPLDAAWKKHLITESLIWAGIAALFLIVLDKGVIKELNQRQKEKKRSLRQELRQGILERVAQVSDSTRLAFWHIVIGAMGSTGAATETPLKNTSKHESIFPSERPSSPFNQVHSFNNLGFASLEQESSENTQAVSAGKWAKQTASDALAILENQRNTHLLAEELSEKLQLLLDELDADRYPREHSIHTLTALESCLRTFLSETTERNVLSEKILRVQKRLHAATPNTPASEQNRTELLSLLESFLGLLT